MAEDTYSAKQVATRIGTDAKTLRKFLRSPASPYEAVGQGSRYEFPKSDLAEIKRAFLKWQKKGPKPAPTKAAPPVPPAKKAVTVTMNDEVSMSMDFDDDPTEEDLEEIAEELQAHFPHEEFDLEIDDAEEEL